MKKIYEDDLEQAWKVVYGDWLEITEIIHKAQAPLPTPETLIIKEQNFKQLSKEAKEVISITIKMMESSKKRPTKERIFMAMKGASFNSPFIAQVAVKEVQTWVNTL